MTIKELKNQIESGVVSDSLLIFECNKNGDFLAFQYINQIARIKNLDIVQIDTIDELFESYESEDIFGADDDIESQLYLYITEKFNDTNQKILQKNNLIIVVQDKISADSSDLFKGNIVKIPKLEVWQIRDYLYSSLQKAKKENLEWLLKICNNDINRIESEIDRLRIFEDSSDLNKVMSFYYYDGVYSDLSRFDILDFVKEIQCRNVTNIKNIYSNMPSLCDSDMLLYSLLCTTFRNLIMVQLGTNISSSTCGLSDKQLYAISKLPKIYTEAQLVQIFLLLTDISKKIRSGTMPTGKFLVDYLIVKILSA